MSYIHKKLINLYLKDKKKVIYVKKKSSTITTDIIGKTVLIYNGKKWVKKKLDNYYLVNKPLGTLRNVQTKVKSVYKSNKKKKTNKKKSTKVIKKKK